MRTITSQPAPHWIGSVLSVGVGVAVYYLPCGLFSIFSPPPPPGSYGLFPGEFPLIVAVLVWAVAFLPLYLRIPAESPLWRWWECTLCGVAGGALAGCVAGFVLVPSLLALPLILLYALVLGGPVGAATCLFASLTAPFFRRLHRFDTVPNRMLTRLKERFAELAGQ